MLATQKLGGITGRGMRRSELEYSLPEELIALARARGCRVLPGSGMAVHQAVGAFELFTGRTPDAARMTRHFEELVG